MFCPCPGAIYMYKNIYRVLGECLQGNWSFGRHDRSSFVRRLVHSGSTDDLLLLQISSGVVWQTRDQHCVSVESSSLLLHSIKSDLLT